MQWSIALYFVAYTLIGVVALAMWWLINELVLTRGYSVRRAVFGATPNAAVALDMLGGFLAIAYLIHALISMAPRTAFRLDVPSVVISIVILLVLMAVLRLLMAVLLRVWFRNRKDRQGDYVTFNNELFRQRNIATSLFSTVLYIVLVAGLTQLDLWDLEGYRFQRTMNMLGIWLLGAIAVIVHSFLYLGYGPKNNILHECFHDNNPAAPCSLLGFVAGLIPLNHYLLILMDPEQHMFSSLEHWQFLGAIVLYVLVARGVLQVALWVSTGINLRRELVLNDNVAWGLLDGGLIFSLFFILMSLLV